MLPTKVKRSYEGRKRKVLSGRREQEERELLGDEQRVREQSGDIKKTSAAWVDTVM